MKLECSVCLDTLSSDRGVGVSRCGHMLHRQCWTDCLARSRTCPQCRKSIFSEADIVQVFLPGVNESEIQSLTNQIDTLKVDLACRNEEYKKTLDSLRAEKDTSMKLREEIQKIENAKKSSESADVACKAKTEELQKLKGELEKTKKLLLAKNCRTRSETEKLRKYEDVVEGLKNCVHEFNELKRYKQLAKKLKIFTDDIDTSTNLKDDVKKDPLKYVEMFQEIRNFWSSVKKREEELKKCPKGCIIHLTGFLPNRMDVLKHHIKSRIEYHGGKVAFITWTPGHKEAFVRLEAGTENPAEELVKKLPSSKLRIKNFTVDAKVLRGEDEMKFLKRSFEDRDKKINRLDSDGDLTDDNDEVGMLEHMMGLVAVA